MKREKTKYRLTPKGLMLNYGDKGQTMYNALCLYLIRIGCNAVVLVDGELHFEKVEWKETFPSKKV